MPIYITRGAPVGHDSSVAKKSGFVKHLESCAGGECGREEADGKEKQLIAAKSSPLSPYDNGGMSRMEGYVLIIGGYRQVGVALHLTACHYPKVFSR